MEANSPIELAPLFQAVGKVLRQRQQDFNQADPYNGNHGDHMVEIFDLAVRAAQEKRQASLAEAMRHAGCLLEQARQNGSAQLYARGLEQFAQQFQEREISLPDLVTFVQGALSEASREASQEPAPELRKSDLLKALVSGLANWGQAQNGQPASSRPLDMGTLFEFGIAYLQAKQRGGSRAEVLADAAVSISPLSRTPHRYQSGKLAIQTLLQAMQALATGPTGQS
ncbi:MAG: hypothetical protein AB1894_01620 [Chloroflexota bacterium]